MDDVECVFHLHNISTYLLDFFELHCCKVEKLQLITQEAYHDAIM